MNALGMGIPLASVASHDGPVNSLAFGTDSSVVYSGGSDGAINRWVWDSTDTHSALTRLSVGDGNVSVIAIDTRSEFLVSGHSDGKIEVLGLPKGDTLEVLTHHSDFVSGIDQHPVDRSFVSGSYDGSVAVFQYPAATIQRVLRDPHDGPVTSIGYDGSGEHLATSGLRSPVYLWNTGDWTTERTLGIEMRTVVCISIVPGSDHLVTVDFDGELCVYDLQTGGIAMRTQIGEDGDYPMAVNDAGSKIAVGTDHSINVYDLDSGSLLDYHPLPDGGVFSVAFTPRDDMVIVGCGTGEIYVWETSSSPPSESK